MSEPAGSEILVVDDDPQLRRLISRVLQRAGLDVATAADGRAALAILQEQHRIRLLITDILMPEQDGIATILACRRDRPELKIIAMSGAAGSRTDVSYLSFAGKLGADCVLQKPFDFDELVATAVRLLGRDEDRRATA